jgi:cell fate regulator YaaT (PSP1 superfamily)
MNQILIEKVKLPEEPFKGPRFLIGVRVENGPKSALFDPGKLNIRVGVQVMVETDQGIQIGVVASNKIPNIIQKDVAKRILRVSNENDLQAQARKENIEQHSKELCLQKIKELNLKMSLSRVTHIPKENKIIFTFTAEGRVDFRQLIKKLISNLKQRIEMKQMGIRDEARIIKGYGVCGEELCCSSFLEDFTPVSIKMAKDQGLALNPSKISGACGRLMCCLQYEHENYKKLVKGMPQVGKNIQTPSGTGRVLKNNIIEQTVLIRLEDESILTYSLDEL